MSYFYDDEFMTKDFEQEMLQRCEDIALSEVDKLDVKDRHYFDRLVVYNVYIQISIIKYENESMQKKNTLYTKLYNALIKKLEVKPQQQPSITIKPMFRG